MLWHDGSTLVNHGHLLFMVASMYDPALYLTDEEFFKKTGRKVNVQAKVETPELYILARCDATDQQLMYIDTRVEDLKELKAPLLSDGVEIYDQM